MNDRVNDCSRVYSVLTEITVDPPTNTAHQLSVIVLMADVIEGKQTLQLTHWSSLKFELPRFKSWWHWWRPT